MKVSGLVEFISEAREVGGNPIAEIERILVGYRKHLLVVISAKRMCYKVLIKRCPNFCTCNIYCVLILNLKQLLMLFG